MESIGEAYVTHRQEPERLKTSQTLSAVSGLCQLSLSLFTCPLTSIAHLSVRSVAVNLKPHAMTKACSYNCSL